jgi:16S rRNA processing protein RimM
MAIRAIGIISKARGTDGKISVVPYIKDIFNIKAGTKLLIGFSENFAKPYTLSTFERSKDRYVISLKENVTREDVMLLKEHGIFADDSSFIEEVKDAESYYIDDLIGCKVIERGTRKEIGEIIDVMKLPANDVWVVKTEEYGEVLLPVIDDVVKKVSVNIKQVFVELIEGLLELNCKKEENDEQ